MKGNEIYAYGRARIAYRCLCEAYDQLAWASQVYPGMITEKQKKHLEELKHSIGMFCIDFMAACKEEVRE